MQCQFIRTDGFVQTVAKPLSIAEISLLIGADTLDTVNLRHLGAATRVMFVDDLGHSKGLPVNHKATDLYHANCKPGVQHVIRGHVVIVFDDDSGGPEL